MKKLKEKSKQFTNHISSISVVLEDYPQFHIAEKKEHENIFNLLESSSMDLKNIQLKYSRRDNLINSYFESYQVPALITDKDNTFLGVISETEILKFDQIQKVFYTSDLRISEQAKLRTRAMFRKMYSSIIQNLNAPCYTAILDENVKAIKALGGSKKNLFYHKVHSYISYSTLILPTILKIKPNSQFKFSNRRDKLFEQEKQSSSSFCHLTNEDDDYFTIEINGATKVSFSIRSPNYRSLIVSSKTMLMSLFIKTLSLLFRKNYEKKIPWIYITSIYIDPELKRDDVLKQIFLYLYKNKKVSSGDLVLLAQGRTELFPDLKTITFKTKGSLFQVSTLDRPQSLKGDIYLNPLFL